METKVYYESRKNTGRKVHENPYCNSTRSSMQVTVSEKRAATMNKCEKCCK